MMQKYLLSNVFRAPDDPVADPAVDPAVVVDPAAVDPAVADPPAAPVQPQPAMVPLRVMQERVGEETTKRQAAEEAARVAIERARSFEEITKRLQADPKATPPAADPTATRAPAPADPQFQTAVQQEAARQRFNDDVQLVSESGLKTYGAKWTEAITALNAYGANSEEFVSNVMDVDKSKTHDIMFQIAQDGELAVRLTKMAPTRRIAEITRMVMAQTAAADPKPAVDAKPADPKPAAALSRAPAPKPAIAPHAPAPDIDPRTPDGDAKMDDKEWEAWYKKTYMKRAG
jgi:hypothetical protein